jgi:hypothetical protein
MLALLLLGCPGPREPADPCSAPDAPTWHNFAQGYVRTWCLGCHSASVAGADRQGAPVGMDFDTWSQVHARRDRIAVRATGDSPDMPPLGGITVEAVARFEQWLACGAQGEDETPGPCDSLQLAAGRIISSQADADALCAEGNAVGALTVEGTASLGCLCEVQGALQLRGGELELPLLQAVTGDLVIEGQPVALRAPALREIGGGLKITGPLQEVSLPALTAVGGDLIVLDGQLRELSFDSLYSVGGELGASRTRLERLDLPRLNNVGGDLVLQDLPDLVSLEGTRALKSVGGSLILRRLPRLPVLDDWAFLLLETVGGDVIIQENAQLVAIHGLTLLDEVPGDMLIQDLPALNRIEGLDLLLHVGGDLEISRNVEQDSLGGLINLERVDGTLRLVDLPSLGSIVGPEALSSVGALQIERTGLPSLSDLPVLAQIDGSLTLAENPELEHIDGMTLLASVGGDLLVLSNPTLSSLSGWAAVETLDGAVEVTDNPALPTSAIEAWLAGVDSVAGPVTVTGNGAD